MLTSSVEKITRYREYKAIEMYFVFIPDYCHYLFVIWGGGNFSTKGKIRISLKLEDYMDICITILLYTPIQKIQIISDMTKNVVIFFLSFIQLALDLCKMSADKNT